MNREVFIHPAPSPASGATRGEGRNSTPCGSGQWDCPSHGHMKRAYRQSSTTRFVATPWVEQGTFPASTGRSCQLSYAALVLTGVVQYP